MRDGRRQRLGLVDGTEGTVQDTYLDRILSDAEVAGEPNILSLDPDANVRTTDQRYVSDAYNYYLGGGPDAAQDDFPIQAEDIAGGGGGGDGAGIDTTTTDGIDTGLTDFEQNLLDQGVGVQGAPGDPVVAPGEMPVTQAEMDEFNAIPVNTEYSPPTSDPFLVSGAAGGARLPQETDLGEITADDYGTPTVFDDTATLADAGAGIDEMYATDYQGEADIGAQTFQTVSEVDANNPDFKYRDQFIEDLRNLPSDIKNAFNESKDAGLADLNKLKNFLMDKGGQQLADNVIKIGNTTIDVAKSLASGAISLIGSALTGVPGLGLLVGMLPEGGPTFQTQKAIELGLAAPGETKDKYGINTQSMMGNYDKYNVDRVEQLEGIVEDQLSRGLTNTIQMRELEDRREYVDRSGAGGDIQPDATD